MSPESETAIKLEIEKVERRMEISWLRRKLKAGR